MNIPRIQISRVRVLQSLTVLVLLMPIAAAVWYIWGAHHAAGRSLADIEPRYARLAGMVEKQSELKAITDQARAQLTRVAYPASLDITQAGNDAQQRIRALFADNRMDIASLQVLPVPKDDVRDDTTKPAALFDRIRIELRVEGGLEGLQGALMAAGAQNLAPAIYLESMTMQTIGAVKPSSKQQLGAQLLFYVLRARE